MLKCHIQSNICVSLSLQMLEILLLKNIRRRGHSFEIKGALLNSVVSFSPSLCPFLSARDLLAQFPVSPGRVAPLASRESQDPAAWLTRAGPLRTGKRSGWTRDSARWRSRSWSAAWLSVSDWPSSSYTCPCTRKGVSAAHRDRRVWAPRNSAMGCSGCSSYSGC